ncbi:MAG: hypothetical protein ACJ786_12200, partial [Catenulispora sp.]
STAQLPPPLKQQAETSAELARNVARQHGPAGLAHHADLAFVHAMHAGLMWAAAAIAVGAVLVVGGFRVSKAAAASAAPGLVETGIGTGTGAGAGTGTGAGADGDGTTVDTAGVGATSSGS